MTKQIANEQLIFTPDSEPYLGRQTVHVLDQVIVTCLDVNARTAPLTHEISKSELPLAACQIIPSGVSLAPSIREISFGRDTCMARLS